MNETTNNGGARSEGRKMLFTASTMSHIENFHLPYIHAFEEMGWQVDAVALPVSKSFFSLKNLSAINYTKKLLKEGNYDVISSHATLAGIVTRLAVFLIGKSRKQMKIFHTSHGYLFHDDHSLKKWAYLLPEMVCGRITNVLMVMNHEDLEIAKKYKLCGKSNKIYYINGMGIDLNKFRPRRATSEERAAFGIKEDDFVFVYAAEFSKRKNHELLLRGFAKAIEELKSVDSNCERSAAVGAAGATAIDSLGSIVLVDAGEAAKGPSATNLKLVLAGDGSLFDDMKALAVKLGIESQVIFLGYTKNMNELYPCCDVAVSTSRIEGLPFNIMEAMACGLPVIASDIKGHRELIEDGVNGLLFEYCSHSGLVRCLIKSIKIIRFRNKCKVVKFSIDAVLPVILGIYKNSY